MLSNFKIQPAFNILHPLFGIDKQRPGRSWDIPEFEGITLSHLD